MMELWHLAGKNVLRQSSRYKVLFAALLMGGASVTAVISLSQGMNEVLKEKAARYFAGHVSVLGFQTGMGNPRITDPSVILQVFKSVTPRYVSLTQRTLYYQNDATLFFAGNSIRQRRLVGVDWDVESLSMAALDISAGEIPQGGDEKALLLSETVAQKLQVRVGDECVLYLTTFRGQKNTITLIVKGIFRDPSFFGYAAYLDRRTLNTAMGQKPDMVTEMGVILNPGENQFQAAESLRKALTDKVELFPEIKSKAALYETLETKWEGTRYAILTLDAHLSQVKDIVDALALVTLALVLVFLAIVAIGVTNSYSMVIQERFKEIGTMRALGMTKSRLLGLLIRESLWLAGAGAIGGLAVGLGVLTLVSQMDFNSQAMAALFTRQGHFVPYLDPLSLGVTVTAVVATTVLGALVPTLRGLNFSPAEALREE